MKVVDPGHVYRLAHLDGPGESTLTFVKREGPGYPGNVGAHEGVTIQEVLRALIHRAQYVNQQIPCEETEGSIASMREALWALEERAAKRHGRPPPDHRVWIELQPTCQGCGHTGCPGCARVRGTPTS